MIVILREATADDDELVPRLDKHGIDIAVGTSSEIDGGIRRTARHEAGDVMAGQAIRAQELADHHKAHYGEPVPCPKCKQPAVRAAKCAKCGKVFVLDRGSVCPACNTPATLGE